jgi:sulfatase maturation enzyme AslB (radical SAM superfamily)
MSETNDNKNVIDYTLFKLQRLQSEAPSQEEAWIIQQCIALYREGTVSIEWHAGEPYVIMEDYNGQAMQL